MKIHLDEQIKFSYFSACFFFADDRFILKEMSIKELTLFENFAPQYFNYIKTCCQKNDLTLLAKLFGVYKVTVKKKE